MRATRGDDTQPCSSPARHLLALCPLEWLPEECASRKKSASKASTYLPQPEAPTEGASGASGGKGAGGGGPRDLNDERAGTREEHAATTAVARLARNPPPLNI